MSKYENLDHSKPESWKYTGTIYGTATTPVVQSAECVCRGNCGMLKHVKLPADFPLYDKRASAEDSGIPESVVMSRDCDEEIAMRQQMRHTAAEERESVAVWLAACGNAACGNVDLAENVRKGVHRRYVPRVETVCDCGRKDCKYCYLLPAAGSCPSCYGVVKPVVRYRHGPFGPVFGGPPSPSYIDHWACNSCGAMYNKCPKKPKTPEQE